MFVDEPWPVPHIFAPRESTVEINCTAGETGYTPFWSIDLANDTKESFLQFNLHQKEQLNAHNVYQLPQIETPGMPPTLRLLINDTIQNNQTRIQCDRSATSESATTLFVVGKVLIYHYWFIIILTLSIYNFCRSFVNWGHSGHGYRPFMESRNTRSG